MPDATLQPRLFLGPSLGISLGGTFHDSYFRRDLTDVKAVDLGVTCGVGLRTVFAGRGVSADLRYTTGFGDLFDVEGNFDLINSVFSLTLGVEL